MYCVCSLYALFSLCAFYVSLSGKRRKNQPKTTVTSLVVRHAIIYFMTAYCTCTMYIVEIEDFGDYLLLFKKLV